MQIQGLIRNSLDINRVTMYNITEEIEAAINQNKAEILNILGTLINIENTDLNASNGYNINNSIRASSNLNLLKDTNLNNSIYYERMSREGQGIMEQILRALKEGQDPQSVKNLTWATNNPLIIGEGSQTNNLNGNSSRIGSKILKSIFRRHRESDNQSFSLYSQESVDVD